MKNVILSSILLLVMGSTVFADQKATLTCTAANATLSVRSPYLGENSTMSQELYVLKSKNSGQNESSFTAYFLDVEPDMGKFGMLVYTGKNEVGGRFQLEIQPWSDAGDGTVIRETSKGKLTYSHGPLRGTDESVFCTKE